MYKIFLDLSWFQKNNTGFNNYILNLIKGFEDLEKNFVIYLGINRIEKKYFLKLKKYKKFKFLETNFNTFLGKLFWHHTIGLRLKNKFDIFLFPNNFLPIFAPKNSFLVVHDLNFKFNKKDFSLLSLLYRYLFQKFSIVNADKVIAISKKTSREIKKFYNINSIIINNPVKPFTYRADTSQKNVILCASSLKKYKNIDAAYQACLSFLILKPNYKIIFIGNWTVNEFPLPINKNPKILLFGYQSETNRNKLFNSAEIILSPSKYEGFGLTYVEALMMSKKLVCCDIDVAREIVRNKAFYIKKPFGCEQIFSALIKAANSKSLLKSRERQEFLKIYSPKYVAKQYFNHLINNI